MLSGMSKDFKGVCVYCNHCLPCSSGIDIAAVTKYLDIALLDRSVADKGAGQHYRLLSARGSDCIRCANCESKCPFSVPIMQNMQKAKEFFE